MPILADINHCCGCSACANKCPKQAIQMEANEEGFLHPLIDTLKCVECKACENVCPGLSPANKKKELHKTYVIQHRDDIIRYQSTSGGAFTAIASEIIRRGGVVFGAVMSEQFYVRHEAVDTIEGLFKFRNSKYVQSVIGHTYKEAKDYLDQGRWVCYSGTPCQINGLCKFLGHEYDHLLTVDVVCKSVPSPLVFQKYIRYKEEREGKLSDVVFRDKKRGFQYCTMAHYITPEDRQSGRSCYRKGSESDEWLRLFLSGRISRLSCFTCPYQTEERVADFTLGDIWRTNIAAWDDNKGTTLVHVWSNKGACFIKNLKSIRLANLPKGESLGLNRKLSVIEPHNREQLFRDIAILSERDFFKKYAPCSFFIILKQTGRFLIWKLHLHNMIRNIKHAIIHI